MLGVENYFRGDLQRTTSHSELFKDVQLVWDVIPKIEPYINAYWQKIAAEHGGDRFVHNGVDIPKNASVDEVVIIHEGCEIGANCHLGSRVVIGKGTKIGFGAFIGDHVIIGENCDIRPGAYIRNHVIVGDYVVVGNSTELKNCLLFNRVEVPHYNYVGDSVLGYKAHLGAGVKLSNFRVDKKMITVKAGGDVHETGLQKFGAIIGDEVEVGCNSVLNPGTMIGYETLAYANSSLNGIYESNKIIKLRQTLEVVDRR